MKIIGIVLIVLGCLLGFLLLLLLLPARVRVAVQADTLLLWGGLGPVMIRVWPRREKKPKKEKIKKRKPRKGHEAPVPQEPPAAAEAKAPQQTAEPAPTAGKGPTVSAQKEAESQSAMPKISLEMITAYCRLAVDAMGQMKRRLVIRQLTIHAVIAAQDAAVTAMAYGSAAAAVNLLLPMLEENFRIRKEDIAVDCDFNSTRPTIEFTIELSAMVLSMLLIGLKVLRRFLQIKNEMKEKAVQV